MVAPDRLENFLWYLGIFLHAALLCRLVWLGLAGKYKAFTLCLALQTARSLILLQIAPNTTSYGIAYFVTDFPLMACRVAVVLEIYGHVLSSYKGLSVLGRGTVLGVLTVSGLVSVLTHLREFDFSHEQFQFLRAHHLLESTVYTTLLFFLVALAAFILWYPVQLKKNLLLYSFGFAIYFVGVAAAAYLRNLDSSIWTRLASTGRLLITDVSLLLMVCLMRKSWEEETRGAAVRFAPDSQERLLAQLEALNRALDSPQ